MDSGLQTIGDVTVNAATATVTTQQALRRMSNSASATIDKTAQNFEGMFMTQMLQPMFASINVDPTFGGGHGEEVMKGFLVQEYGKIAAKSGKLGIAAAVKKEMIKAQESLPTSKSITMPISQAAAADQAISASATTGGNNEVVQ